MISHGAKITEGQAVMELETDKAVVEVPSSLTGTVKEVRVKEGEKVKVGQVIFTVENGAKGKSQASAEKKTGDGETNGAKLGRRVEPSATMPAESGSLPASAPKKPSALSSGD